MEGNAMGYVTITTWELADGSDWNTNLRNVREHRLPALIEMGATNVTVVRTSAAISEWPDAKTRDDAMHLIEQVRGKTHTEDGFRMTGEMRGVVVAEV
jgi:hypothetical protein